MMMTSKAALRAQIRALHEGREVRDAQSGAICRCILESEAYRDAKVIGGYMPLVREADVLPVLQDVLRQGKTLALPLCDDPPHMTMRRVDSLSELQPGAYGIAEPPRTAEVLELDEIDLLLVPLEAIDGDGYRLGKGGGYYDCLLPRVRAVTVGCALTWQWVGQTPRDGWDIPLQVCADMQGLHWFNK